MAPGRKGGNRQSARREPIEAPPTAYELQRAQNLLEKNRMFQRLGLGQLRSLVSAMPKATARKEPDPLYEPGDEDTEPGDEDTEPGERDTEDRVVNKGPELSKTLPSTGGSRASKRVMALQEQSQPARMTRQRTREIPSADEFRLVATADPQDGPIEDGLNALDAHAQSVNQNMTEEGQGIRKIRRVGRELDRISKGLNTKIKVHVADGNRRPEAPIQAAKLASEAGIALRDHLPIFPHWKDYMDKKNQDLLDDYKGKIASHFSIEATNKKAVDYACLDLLKKGQRNMRYLLKRKFFNGIPANQVRTTSPVGTMTDEQWKALVDMWSNPKHKEKCLKAKDNRELVKYQQKTGSRSYIAQCYVTKAKFKDDPPTAIDFFKATHCSSKTGYSEDAQKAIDEMEAIAAQVTEEGQVVKTPTQAVAQVLRTSKFLKNIGIEPTEKKRSAEAAELAMRVEELESELVAEKEGAAEVRVQMDDLKDQVEEERDARRKMEEETASLKNQINEMHGFFKSFFAANSASSNAPQ